MYTQEVTTYKWPQSLHLFSAILQQMPSERPLPYFAHFGVYNNDKSITKMPTQLFLHWPKTYKHWKMQVKWDADIHVTESYMSLVNILTAFAHLISKTLFEWKLLYVSTTIQYFCFFSVWDSKLRILFEVGIWAHQDLLKKVLLLQLTPLIYNQIELLRA